MVLKLGILASGRGSDFQAILDHVKMGILQNVTIEVLVCNVENAFVIERAKNQGIGTNFIQGSAGMKFESNNEREKFREDFDSKIIEIFNKKDIDLVVCAGFNQIISNVLVKEFTNRILNIHPAYDVKRFGGYGMVGMKVHEAVIKEREEIRRDQRLKQRELEKIRKFEELENQSNNPNIELSKFDIKETSEN